MNTPPTTTRTITEIFRSDINGYVKVASPIDHCIRDATIPELLKRPLDRSLPFKYSQNLPVVWVNKSL